MSTLWKELALLAVAGAVGTMSRYAVSGMVHRACGSQFPWGTVTVNLTGCFLFGLIWTITEGRPAISAQTRFILLTGFMGAFTTFSTLAFETAWFMQNSQWWLAAGNALGQLIAGLMVVFLGFAVGRLL